MSDLIIHSSLKRKYVLQPPPDIIKGETIFTKKTTKPLKKPKRCCFEGCKTKLKLTDMACGCQKYFCSIHRLPHSHKCININKCKETLNKKIMDGKCITNKVDKI